MMAHLISCSNMKQHPWKCFARQSDFCPKIVRRALSEKKGFGVNLSRELTQTTTLHGTANLIHQLPRQFQ